MLKFYGDQPPSYYKNLRPGGICPYCKETTRFSLTTILDEEIIKRDKVENIILSYACDGCLQPIPIRWSVDKYQNGNLRMGFPNMVLSQKENFDLNHVPEIIRVEIEEALNCLSVNAYNGFAALCRRTIQAICTNLGTGASDKVKNQVNAMIEIAALGEEWRELTTQIMLTGHDGAHPHLPEVNSERAAILLSLMQDLTYELYTRPGKIREAAALRQKAINQSH